MERTILEPIAVQAGVIEQAVPDALARAQHHFGDRTPDAAALAAWVATLRETAPHLFARPVPDLPAWLSPTEKLARGHADHPAPVTRQRGHNSYITDPHMQAELAKIASPTERLSKARQWLATQGA